MTDFEDHAAQVAEFRDALRNAGIADDAADKMAVDFNNALLRVGAVPQRDPRDERELAGIRVKDAAREKRERREQELRAIGYG